MERAISAGRISSPSARPRLEQLAREALEVRLAGSQVEPAEIRLEMREQSRIEIAFRYPRAPTEGKFEVRSILLPRLPGEHRQFTVVVGEDGIRLAEYLLGPGKTAFALDLTGAAAGAADPAAPTAGFLDFFRLGIEHILEGYDHLLFLFGLLLVCARIGAAVKIITTFTVAHSITLALATFDLVQLPAAFVEATIAASIVYIGVENLLRQTDFNWRWLLVFAFGLIHGLGFAGALREMGISSSAGGIATALLGFNLGVETVSSRSLRSSCL